MPTLMVIRHSIAQANEQGIMMGSSFESPLSETGIALARAKGRGLRAAGFKPDVIFTSPLTRAKQTATIIAEELGLTIHIVEHAGLIERDFGIHTGKPYQSTLDAFAKYGDNPPSVEPVDTLVARVMNAFIEIKNQTTGTTLVVTHSNPEMIIRAALFHPDMLSHFWDLGDAEHCEGFSYQFTI